MSGHNMVDGTPFPDELPTEVEGHENVYHLENMSFNDLLKITKVLYTRLKRLEEKSGIYHND